MFTRNVPMKFSIIVPTYNRAHLIVETLLSVKKQTYTNWELIIVDDGSTDNTEDILKEYLSEQIRYIRISNGERGRARNTGVSYASGDYVTFLDSDDRLYPEFLSSASAFLISNSLPEILSVAFEIRDDKGKLLSRHVYADKFLNKRILHSNVMACIGVVIRKDIASGFTFHEDRGFMGVEDWLLWLRIGARFSIYHLPVVGAVLLQHAGRSVMHYDEDAYLYRVSVLCNELRKDFVFIQKFSDKAVERIKGHMFTYTALFAMASKHRISGLKYWIKGVLYSPGEVFTRRTLAIFKHMMLP